ncbi:endonuclease/exonuclease/phosphatase family protein [Shewanella basaltis]|uniref:endonuclease/exonuclease/phosphatase family protein n=1 Tax=Shewanella basaltis TaxID=472183 RepID=UPI003AAE2C13
MLNLNDGTLITTSDLSFTVVSINLFNFIEPPYAFYDFENIYSDKQWQKKCAWLSDFINQSQPDIIGFQEVFSPDALAKLTQSLGYEYFVALDEPEVISDYVYRSPVVAIASKYPIVDSVNVSPDPQWITQLGLADTFAFSRKPLRATIQLPVFGPCDCYVIHLKSKRSGVSRDDMSESGLQGGPDFVARQVLGWWASSLQRGSESALLCHQMLMRRQQSQQPFMLMGDFNDTLGSELLAAFNHQLRVFRSDIEDPQLAKLGETSLMAELHQSSLYDSYELFIAATKCNATLAQDEFESASLLDDEPHAVRQATHYYGNTGSVLDYILVSSEFNPAQQQNLAHIIDYQTFDRHLVRPDYERDSDSTDHAPVMMRFAVRT